MLTQDIELPDLEICWEGEVHWESISDSLEKL